jgi:predicted PurR-regulated permease PerM
MNDKLIKTLLVIAIAVGIGTLLVMVTAVFDRVHTTMIEIVFAILFAYAIYPPVKLLAARGLPVPLAALCVYVILGILVIGALAWLAPTIASQVETFTREYPHLVAQTQKQIADPVNSPLLSHLPASVRTAIAANAGKAGTLLGGVATGIGMHTLEVLTGTTALLVSVGLILGLTLLILGDLTQIQAFATRLVPVRYRPSALAFMNDVDEVIGGFVRGQVLLAIVVAVAGTIVLILLGVPFGILLGVLAGIVSIVPLIGPIIACIPVIVISFFTVGLIKAIVVGVLFAIIIGVQQNVLVPIFVARSVGVTPLVIFVALLLGSEAFGILGALLSIPIAGILRVATERIFPHEATRTDTGA